MSRTLAAISTALVLALTGRHAGAAIVDTFESYVPGTFPGGAWRDIGTSADPSPDMPTGQVIETTGPDGAPTRAFQVHHRRTTSQGLIADIDVADRHRVRASLRVDVHPTPPRVGDWTSAMGFFQEDGPPIDINREPQGVVYVYDGTWYFYGATRSTNFINVRISDVLVMSDVWYDVTLEADTATGEFAIRVSDIGGSVLVDTSVAIPNFEPARGLYNRVAVFDGEYTTGTTAPGQFTVDNLHYVPSPGAAMLLLLGASRRATRRTTSRNAL